MNAEVSSRELLGIGELLSKAWEIYKKRMITLILVGLGVVLLPLLSLVPFVGLGFVVSLSLPELRVGIMSLSILLGVIAMAWVGNWAFSAFLTAIVDEKCDIKEAFQKGKPKIIGHMWLAMLTALILTGAHLLLIIPGIIFTVWFFFAPFVFIDEDVRGMNALLKSKEYVRGRWSGVGLRLLAIWLIAALVSAIPVIGQLIALFLIPFSFIYSFLLYQNLKAIRDDLSFQPTGKEKIGIVATGTLGYVLPVIVVFALMGSMFMIPFSMLKAKITGQSPFPVSMGQPNPSGHIVKTSSFKVTSMAQTTGADTRTQIAIPEDKTQDWTKRSQVAFRLGQSKDSKAINPLIAALRNNEKWMVRKNAADSLATLGTHEAVPSLISALESDKNVFVREAAAKALGNLGDERAVEPLQNALRDQGVVMTQKEGKMVKEKSVAKAAGEALKHFSVDDKKIAFFAKKSTATTERAQKHKKDLKPQPINEQKGPNNKKTTGFEKSVKACTKAIKIRPEDALAYHNRAVAHFRLGHYQRAVDDFNKAIEFAPGEATTYYNRAIAYGILGKHKEAIEDGTKTIKLNSQYANAYVNRGIDYLASGNCDKAFDDFNKAIEFNSKDFSAYYARGVAYYKLGSNKRAIKDFEKAAQMGSQKARDYLKTREVLPPQS